MTALRHIGALLLAALLIGGLVSACGAWFRTPSYDECRSDRDCPRGQYCDECAKSSCEDCDDCIAACEDGPRPRDDDD